MQVDPRTPLSSSVPQHFIQADDDDDDDFDEDSIPAFTHPQPSTTPLPLPLDKGKGRAQDTLLSSSATAAAAPNGTGSSSSSSPLAGNIGTPANGTTPKADRRTVGGVRVETRSTGVDTLDEPVSATIARDLLSIYSKLVQVLWPRRQSQGKQVLRDWDLWGPLILCLCLGIMLSLNAPAAQSLPLFSGVVVIISLGSVIVTIQAKLLGGRVSFLQAMCVLGYCVAPLDAAAFIACFVSKIWIRIPVVLGAWVWCVWASVNFLDGTKIEPTRILLAVYPILLFYFVLAWMILIS